jgi:predicted MPP superfamily phosphohydrolase
MKTQTEKAVVIGDLHIPFHDKRTVKLVLSFIKWFSPDKIFLNGDIIDCWEISRFQRPLSIEERLKDEIQEGIEFLRTLRKTAPKAEIIYIFGNHEYRFEMFIAKNARELHGLKGMTLEEQLELKELKIKPINSHQRENFYRYGHMLIGHFNKVNKHSAYTAKNLLDEKGISLIQSHTHRGGVSYKHDFVDFKVAVENFCLCELNPPYLSIPNWQPGFSTVHTDPKTKFFKITPVEIVQYHIIYGDQVFKG